MKKTVICNIPMKERIDKVLYTSDDASLPVAERMVSFPICAFLEKTLSTDDELDVIILVKKNRYVHYEKNVKLLKTELMAANVNIGATINYCEIDTDFEQTKSVHEQLMGQIIDALSVGSHILVDMTYGPKDLPIVIFSALNFAEKFLDCTVDNIVYGQASFVNGQPVDTKICDMIPLYCLGSVTNMIRCDEPEKARSMLKALLAL